MPNSPLSYNYKKLAENALEKSKMNVLSLNFGENKRNLKRTFQAHPWTCGIWLSLFTIIVISITCLIILATHKSSWTWWEQGVPEELTYSVPICTLTQDSLRFDCYPRGHVTQELCETRGCCWRPLDQPSNKSSRSDDGIPYCYYPQNYDGYKFKDFSHTETGERAELERTLSSPYPGDVKRIRIDASYVSENVLRVKVYDPANVRFEVPLLASTIKLDEASALKKTISYSFNFTGDSGFKVMRKSNGRTLFDTGMGGLTFADQFLQISSRVPSTYLYGLGERRSSFVQSFDWRTFTLFNHDVSPANGLNLYGTHPFYLMMEEDGNSHGVLLLNSNAMDIVLQPTPAITYRTIGGVLDFFFFLGSGPADVVSQYTSLVGRPMIPPYWGLGFQLCRWNYGSSNRTRQIWQQNRNAGIPFDVQWNDIDYMADFKDFTYDNATYHGLPSLVTDIHKSGMHYVSMIDPFVSSSQPSGSYPPFDSGAKLDIFIKNESGQIFQGQGWFGPVAYPDFSNPNSWIYWEELLQQFHNSVSFDGIWLDMNEPSNMISGPLGSKCPNNSLENPPYLPGVDGKELSYRTLCMSASHHISEHYNVHSLHSLLETMATYEALKGVREKRPFIISRSSFPGLGKYAGHWTGDIYSVWDDMRQSVTDIMLFNMFGIPFVGADICGFEGNTTIPLCQRWMELGAFYPFSRNHNDYYAIDQDPASLGPEVVNASKNALGLRYRLLPYLYTLFYRAQVYGDTVVRPLFFEYPNDIKTYNLSTQFLWGPSLLIVPVLEEHATEVEAYLPTDTWVNINTMETYQGSGSYLNIPVPMKNVTVLARGGTIIPMQENWSTTMESRWSAFTLTVIMDAEMKARGELFWDDGDSIATIEAGKYNLIEFTAHQNSIASTVIQFQYEEQKSPMSLGTVLVYGVRTKPDHVVANMMQQRFTYDEHLKLLRVINMDVGLKDDFLITWV